MDFKIHLETEFFLLSIGEAGLWRGEALFGRQSRSA